MEPLTIIIILLILILPAGISVLQISGGKAASDHFVHLSIIRQIRHNKHRFIKERTDSLYNQGMVFPQLLYWACSFLPESKVPVVGKYVTPFFSFCSSAAFVWFCWEVAPLTNQLSFSALLLFSGLTFLLTPYTFNFTNAKNLGFSLRGMGLFFGQLYLYLMTLFHLGGNYWYFAIAVLAVLIIYLSSQFAIQFVLFSAIPLALCFKDGFFLLAPLSALVIFFALMPQYAFMYFRLQITHKKFYSKYVAKRYILSQRYSIWRDFVYDFWKFALRGFRRNEKGQNAFMYFYSNPVFTVLLGFPFIGLMTGAYFLGEVELEQYGQMSKLFLPILVGLLLFFMTSFRFTRFLGEPERYVEFTTGFISLCAVFVFYHDPFIIYLGLGISGLIMIIQLFIYLAVFTKKKTIQRFNHIDAIEQFIQSEVDAGVFTEEQVRVMSNNFQVTRMLMNGFRKIFWGPAISEKVGKFHYAEVFESYPVLLQQYIKPIIKDYEINHFVLDRSILPEYEDFLKDPDIQFKEQCVAGELTLYQVKIRHQATIEAEKPNFATK